MFSQSCCDDVGKLVLRLTVAGLMLFHGVAKIIHPGSLEFIGNLLAGRGIPSALGYGVYLGEVLAPLLIILGFHCRLGGLLIVANMLFAIGLVHMAELSSLTPHGGWAIEVQAFYLLGGLSVALLGSGSYAVKPD